MVKNRRVTIRNHSAEANLFIRRAVISFIGVCIMLLILFNNIYDLEVNSYEKYQTRSNSNRIKLLPVAPNRGIIYDRNGVLLADNKPVYSLEIIPEQVGNIDTTIEQLSLMLDISAEKQEKFFKELKSKRRFKPIELLSRLSDQQVALFSVNQHNYPGVLVEARLKRYYPFGELTTHSLGYVGRINRRDEIRLEEQGKSETYAATRDLGKLGLEKYYESILHGGIGHQEVEVNNQGRILRTLSFTPPTPGSDLTLSLDIELQMVAKRALIGQRGAIVALDPRDGGVLAMYSNPSYDGNLFVHGISSKNYKKLIQSTDKPLINRSVQGYPPASTIKPFIALTGLEENIVTPDSKIWDPGWYQIKNVKKKYRDWKKWGHGWVDLSRSMEQSCNIYYYDLAYKLGIDRISSMMAKFGFGDYTGIDIYEESDGILPSAEWKRANKNKPWYAGETISVGIGQSFWLVTPLQLAQATSILVNRGKIISPRLVREIKNNQKPEALIQTLKNTEITESENDTELTASELSDELAAEKILAVKTANDIEEGDLPPIVLKNDKNWQHVLDGLHNTVQVFGATAHNAFRGAKYDAAGKTGSAQVASLGEDEKYDAATTQENQRDNAMFIAFAPFNNPEIVVAVAMENVAKGGGATNAAPVARQIMDQYFGDRFAAHEITSFMLASNQGIEHAMHQHGLPAITANIHHEAQ
ncbi:MAG: penicillin-binding protein 2 [Thalassotalea sp.]